MNNSNHFTALRGRNKPATARTIGIFGYEGVQALDLIGPADAFAIADEQLRASGSGGYKVLVLGIARKVFTAESGALLKPHTTLEQVPPLDTIVIPGGKGLRLQTRIAQRISLWLKETAPRIRRVASVCTGIYALACTGLLDGRRVTTHWRFAQDVAQRFPRLQMDANALFIKSGKFYTAAGITAGIDLALTLIEEDHGPGLALSVARELVIYLKRAGGQEQYSEPLQFQTRVTDRLADLVPWMTAHLRHDLSVEMLAQKACLSPRHFVRRFKQGFGANPGEFVESLRLDEARRRLCLPASTIEGVADSVGFASADSFRRAFQRRFGLAPSAYRGRFQFTGSFDRGPSKSHIARRAHA
jgi:transcriptional regulator GlxA family with amidase domain